MKIRLHPLLIPLFLILFITGNISFYALIFISLIIHELGHLVTAKWLGVRVSACTIMPYGGELTIEGRYNIRRKKRMLIAIGGPIATCLLLIIAFIFPITGKDFIIRIQIILLSINLLPFLPLDGGQVVSAFIEKKGQAYEARLAMIVHSIIFYAIVTLMLSFSFKKTFPFIILALFLLITNISAYRYRKYEKVLIELKP